MKKKIFYIIRYSVLQDSNQWRISRDNDYNGYREALFSEERLDLKYFLFSEFTLPSVLEQKRPEQEDNYEIILLTSTELPQQHVNKLDALAKRHNSLSVLTVPPSQSFVSVVNTYLAEQFQKSEEDCIYATVRLDDDDVLHRNFERRLRFYTAKINMGYMVTFSQGHEAFMEAGGNHKLTEAIELYYPKIALGLSLISFYSVERAKVIGKNTHVYQTGKHTTVNQRYSLIEDTTPNMYVRISYDMQDTQAGGFFKRVKNATKTDLAFIADEFPVLA